MHSVLAAVVVFLAGSLLGSAGAAHLPVGQAPGIAPAQGVVAQVHHKPWHRGGRGRHLGWYKKNKGKHKGWR
jgi:hypothetical protein